MLKTENQCVTKKNLRNSNATLPEGYLNLHQPLHSFFRRKTWQFCRKLLPFKLVFSSHVCPYDCESYPVCIFLYNFILNFNPCFDDSDSWITIHVSSVTRRGLRFRLQKIKQLEWKTVLMHKVCKLLMRKILAGQTSDSVAVKECATQLPLCTSAPKINQLRRPSTVLCFVVKSTPLECL